MIEREMTVALVYDFKDVVVELASQTIVSWNPWPSGWVLLMS
jgi:hypothetical protein